MTRVVRAAGGLVIRKTKKERTRVLLVHRPSYDDWSLPKGKSENGELPEATAVREVVEETGYRCRIVSSLGITRYPINGGVKEVAWYAMRPLPDSPGFTATSEVDDIVWLSPGRALEKVAYQNERELIQNTDLEGLIRTGTIRLLRHADAGSRDKWAGDDVERPLSKKGRLQATALAESLRDAGVDRVLTSPYARCVETVGPIAAAIGAKVEVDDRLAESNGSDDGAIDLIKSLEGSNAVLCTHGDVIPEVMTRLKREGIAIETPVVAAKGSIWEIDVDVGKYVEARYVAPPGVAAAKRASSAER